MNGNWEVETSVQSRRVEAGKLTSRADAPLALSVPVDWGWYRMEVYDPATGAASSVRFQAGWRAGPVSGAAPDKVKATPARERQCPGESARPFTATPPPRGGLCTVPGHGRVESKRQS